MRSCRALMITATVLSAAGGCRGRSTPVDAARKAVQADAERGIALVWQAYQAAGPAADVPAFLAITTEDVALSSPGMPTVRGQAGLRAFLEEGFKAAHYSEVSIFPDAPMIIGDRATQFGTYRETYTTSSGKRAIRDYGQFAAELRRGADGKWRIARQLAAKDSSAKVGSR